MRKFLVATIPLSIFVLTIFAVSTIFNTRPKPERNNEGPRPLSVFVVPVETENVTLTVSTQGEVRPQREIDITPQVAGKIDYVAPSFLEGGRFAKDEMLVRIEEADYKLRVIQAEARVAEAKQLLERELAEAEMARREWEQLGRGEPSDLTLRKPQVAERRARLAAAEADLQEAALALERCRIKAPFDGSVRMKNVDVGQYVTPGNPLGRIFSTDIVEIKLPLTDLEQAITGLPIGYEAPEGGGPLVELNAIIASELHSWVGHIARTAGNIDSQTRVLNAFAEVVDPYGEGSDNGVPLAVGLFVNAEIQGREIEGALVIPRAGLRTNDQVYIVRPDNKLDIRNVEIISSSPDRVILRNGVEDGELVVVSPLPEPYLGMPVQPRREGDILGGDETRGDEETGEEQESGEGDGE